ncbi:hypothetical protein [Streptomyces sp. RFCAC02]|uniref:hypothetical protein n=1 Tax=Streptomyces sp. RFCAC02 TaxID=2499143 RepID=UPI0010202CBC|nr:hypothetical protein [Streptomyces sp. RFCAC02]
MTARPTTAGATAEARRARNLARYALLVCVATVAAAVLSLVRGNWIGLVCWILMAGLASNMGWYYLRRSKARTPAP